MKMHYRTLIFAHMAFYQSETRAHNYDRYIRTKSWESWEAPLLPLQEINRLFRFIRSWDRFFQGDSSRFRAIHEEIFPIVGNFRHKNIENVSLTSKDLSQIAQALDKVADCCLIDRHESTDASKILHTILPGFFIMWDREIRRNTLGREDKTGKAYAFEFLPKMQKELEEAINSCMTEKNIARRDAIDHITSICDGKTLAKLADEYNYMLYTMPQEFLTFIEENASQLPPKLYQTLKDSLTKSMQKAPVLAKPTRKLIEQSSKRRREQDEYRNFVGMLNKLQAKKKITGTEWREYEHQWKDFPEGRTELVRRLESLLKEH